MTAERVRCRRCRSEAVDLYETTEESHHWMDGVMLVGGELQPIGEAIHRTGRIADELTRLVCTDCGYKWRPRRPVGMPYEPTPSAR